MERRADVSLRTCHASGYPRENLPTPPTDRLQGVPSRDLALIAHKSSGFRPMLDNGIDMVCKGITTLDEIETISLNLQMFEL
jgi:hypothetical protein